MDILIIRFSSLGDVVLSSSVIEALHAGIPDLSIHFLTKSTYTPLYESDNRVEHVTGIQGDESPQQIVKMLGRSDFDAVIDLHDSLRSRTVTFYLKSPDKRKISKHAFARRFMIWTRNRFRRSFDTLGSYLDTIASFGIHERILPRLLTDETAVEKARNLLGDRTARYIGIAPGAKHSTKRWNEASFAELGDDIARRGFIPVFIGDESDAGCIGRIQGMMGESSLSCAAKMGLSTTVSIISILDGIVTNDSGPMHIAGALGVPVVSVFGPTHPDLGFAPGYSDSVILHSGISCSPCSIHGKTPCRRDKRYCMDDITADMVSERLFELIK